MFWFTTHIRFEVQSRALRSAVLDNIPASNQALFVNDIRYDHNGFTMLPRLVNKINPNTPESIMLTILELNKLEQGAAEDGTTFLSCIKGIENLLATCNIQDILPLFQTSIVPATVASLIVLIGVTLTLFDALSSVWKH